MAASLPDVTDWRLCVRCDVTLAIDNDHWGKMKCMNLPQPISWKPFTEKSDGF